MTEPINTDILTDVPAQSPAAVSDEPLDILQENIRYVTVPILPASVRESFENKGIFFVVNHSKTIPKMQGSSFLTFLTNLNVPCDVQFDFPIPYEEYETFMKAYMAQRTVCPLAGAHVMMAELLLYAKGLPYVSSPYAMPIDESILKRFLDENKEEVAKWLHFIDSTQVFALSTFKALKDHFKPEEKFEVIEDKNYVGANIAQLFRIPEFIAFYFNLQDVEYKFSYFKHQFEDLMFKNEKLVTYFNSKNNMAALMFRHFAAGSFEAKDIDVGLFAMGVFDSNSPHYVEALYVPPAPGNQ